MLATGQEVEWSQIQGKITESPALPHEQPDDFERRPSLGKSEKLAAISLPRALGQCGLRNMMILRLRIR